jgi:ABC-type phosphate transport system substrate-binding protein
VTAPAGALLFAMVAARPPAPAAVAPAAVPIGALAIVVHRSNPTDDLSLAELRSLFLGERQRWPNGRRITLVLQEPGQPEREAALRLVYRMTEAEIGHHFLRAVYRGQAVSAPKTLSSADRVLRFVFNVPGAIGCVPLRDVDGTVKVLRVDGRPPTDAAYPLRLR